MEYCEKLAS